MERMKDITIDGISYLVRHDASNGTLIIERKQPGGNTSVDMNSNIEEYRKVLEEYQRQIKKDEIEIILDEIKNLIDTAKITSYEDLYKYYNEKGYSQEQINKINEQIKPYAENKLENKSIYSDVLDKLVEELNKPRSNTDSLNIALYKENGLLKVEAKRTYNMVENYLFDHEISFDYTEQLEQEFINKFVTKFAERHHHTDPEIHPYGIEYADLHMFSSSNAILDLKGISEGYANQLEKEIKKVPVKNIQGEEQKDLDDADIVFEEDMTLEDFQDKNKGLMNDPEKAQNKYYEYKKNFKGKNPPPPHGGNILLKAFIILALEAAIALSLITYLIIK